MWALPFDIHICWSLNSAPRISYPFPQELVLSKQLSSRFRVKIIYNICPPYFTSDRVNGSIEAHCTGRFILFYTYISWILSLCEFYIRRCNFRWNNHIENFIGVLSEIFVYHIIVAYEGMRLKCTIAWFFYYCSSQLV